MTIHAIDQLKLLFASLHLSETSAHLFLALLAGATLMLAFQLGLRLLRSTVRAQHSLMIQQDMRGPERLQWSRRQVRFPIHNHRKSS